MKEVNRQSGLVPLPPDGGWGWMVLIGSFVSYFLADGWSYSFGVLFPSLLEVFNEGKGKTSLIAALLYGVPLLLSPIVCALTTSYGCRVIAIIGGLLTAGSMILTAFAGSITQICITIGLLGSLGLAMAYLPALIIVTFYFEKKRGLATGLAVTGSGLGSILFPFIMQYLLERYFWRGFLLILGALCLHIVLAGFLFRPPPMGMPSPVISDEEEVDTTNIQVLPVKQHNALHNAIILPRLHRQDTKDIQSCVHLDRSGNVGRHRFLSGSDLYLSTTAGFSGGIAVDMEQYTDNPKSVSNPEIYTSHEHSTVQPIKKDSCSVTTNETKNTSNLQQFWIELKIIVSSILDKSLLKSWAFLLFCGSNFILYLWIGVPYIFLIDRALDLDLMVGTHYIYFLASIIGIGRTIGQIVIGFLGDVPQINCNILYAVCVIVIGLATILVPLCTNYASLCAFAAIYGFFVSATYAIQMMCVVDIVGLDKTTSAFGLLQLLQGIATILGTPLAGWLFDSTGAYGPTFYTSGAWMMLSGVLLLPVARLMDSNKS